VNTPAAHPAHTRRSLAAPLLLALFIAIAGSLLGWMPAPAQAASQAAERSAPRDCLRRVDITSWRSEEQLARNGFIIERYAEPASVSFGRDDLRLSLATAPAQTSYAASRITEIDPHPPILARKRCWQPTADRAVEIHYKVRFADKVAPPELISNLVLWNAPFPFQDGTTASTETALPVTSFGVSRLYGLYVAAASQDFDPATGAGLLRMNPMPTWLDPTAWHEVTILLTTTTVEIRVAQKDHAETILTTPLLRAPDPLGFQFSIDNDALGAYNPINQGDQIDIDRFSIRYRQSER
jgi:hypothetical protein